MIMTPLRHSPKQTAKRARDNNEKVDLVIDTPRVAERGSSSRLIDIMDSRLAKLTESLANMIRQSESRIVAELNSSIVGLKNELVALSDRVDCVEATFQEVKVLRIDVGGLEARINQLENREVAGDLRIHGVPMIVGENLNELFQILCKAVGTHVPEIRHIYRVKGVKSGVASDIIVKMKSHIDKNYIMRSVTKFRRDNRLTNLCLSHIGMQSENPLFLNENLSKYNHEIFRGAQRLKKNNQLWSVFSLGGLVHVKKHKDDSSAICIDEIGKLKKLEVENESIKNNENSIISIPCFHK